MFVNTLIEHLLITNVLVMTVHNYKLTTMVDNKQSGLFVTVIIVNF